MRSLLTTALILCAALLVFVPGEAAAELATREESELVCENWLAYTVHELGYWAGTRNPLITDVRELTTGDTLLARCFNIHPRGSVVVPVLMELPPVVFYSEEFHFTVDTRGGIPELTRDVLRNRMNLFADAYGSIEVRQADVGGTVFDPVQREEWDRFTVSGEQFASELERGRLAPMRLVGPLLTTRWDQRSPYWDLCPDGDQTCTDCCPDDPDTVCVPKPQTVVGCVATATSQIMKYHEWPPPGVPGADSVAYTWDGDTSCENDPPDVRLVAYIADDFDWANMPDSCDIVGGVTAADSAALAELCYEVGVAFTMDYGVCGSSATTSYSRTVLPTYFRYDTRITRDYRSAHDQTSWFNLIKNEINADRPVLYRIYKHAIVCDGWSETGGRYFHINYGWRGSDNTGFFIIDNLPGSVDYFNEEYAVHKIKPMFLVKPGGDGDYATIQAAVDAVPDDSIIELADGTFTGAGNRNIEFDGKTLIVRSHSGNPDACVIDLADTGRAFNFAYGEGPATVVEGITIKNGLANWGAGISCFLGSSPTIRNCMFTTNSAVYEGGGIFVDGTSSSPRIERCIFNGNYAGDVGGAIGCDDDSSPTITRCSFFGNSAGDAGAALSCSDATPAQVSRNIMAYNMGGGAVVCVGSGSATLTCCDIYSNTGGNWTDCIAGQVSVNGNMETNPLFCSTPNDFTLCEDSPCLAANNSCAVTIGARGEGCGLCGTPADVTSHPESHDACESEATLFGAVAAGTPPLSYRWRKNGTPLTNGGYISGATSDTLRISAVQTSHAADYDLVVTNATGSDTSYTATLTVLVPPSITSHPQSRTVAQGDSVDFSFGVTGSDLSYSWSRDGTPISNNVRISGATTSTLVIDPVEWGDEGAYVAVALNVCNVVTSNAATLTVNAPPSVTEHPESQIICPGDPFSFSVTASGTAPLGYQWRHDEVNLTDGGRISGATTSTVTISSMIATDAGDYDVMVTNTVGADTSDAATLTEGGPPVITQHPYGFEICKGDPMELNVAATAAPPAGYQWRWNGVPLSDDAWISGATTNYLTIDPVRMSDAGTYDVVVTNDCGTVTSGVAAIVVWPTPLYVPDGGLTIQAAVDSVCPYGGVVILRDGIHTVSDTNGIDFHGKAITVRSQSGDPATCTVDCMLSGRAFIFQSGEGTDSRLQNLTITNGSISGSGGGVLCVASSGPTIENCVFRSNSASQNGGGIACIGSAPAITGCFFSQNTALGSGGGISQVNTAVGIHGCTFSGNTAGSMGGGLYGAACGDPWIEYCTFHGNMAPTGSGICVSQSAYAQVRNCIVAFNLVGRGVDCALGAGAWLVCCDLFGNAGGDWGGWLPGQAPPNNNNLWANPLFCGAPIEDFTLDASSPCVGATGCDAIGAWPIGCNQASSSWTAGVADWSSHLNWSNGEPSFVCVAAISNGGTAQITQSGEVCAELHVPDGAGPEGHVSMIGGDLTAGFLTVSGDSVCTFTQSGGTVNVPGDGVSDGEVKIGVSGGSGSYDLSGGLLSADHMFVGTESGTGSLELSGSGRTEVQVVWAGHQGGHGTIDVSGGGELSATMGALVGDDAGGTGELQVYGGGQVSGGSIGIEANSGTSEGHVSSGGTVSCGSVCVECSGSGSSTLHVSDGGHVAGAVTIDGSGSGTATFLLTEGGQLDATDVNVGQSSTGGTFEQEGGTASIESALYVGFMGTGRYDLAGGSLTARDILIGGMPSAGAVAGTLSIGSASAEVTVTHDACFWETGVLVAEPGVELHMTGAPPHFDIRSSDPVALADLARVRLIFEGGTGIGALEVAGKDLGPVTVGFDSNFALHSLAVGGDDIGEIRLTDVNDNQPAWTGSEAQYVEYLEIGAGSYLDLNGLHLYYLIGSIDPGATIVLNGGGLTQITGSPVEGSLYGVLTDAGTAMLRWTVASLADIEGFDVLRATSPDGPFLKLNEEVITPSSPCSYEDETVWPETTFWYEVRARLTSGAEDALQGSPISVTTSGRLTARLYRPVPNPFNTATTLRFDVPSHSSRVRLAVWNIAGRLVKTLAGDETERGRHSVDWNGTDEHGRRVSQGVYFARLEVDTAISRQKIVLIR